MKRDLAAMAATEFDLLVIGGGITGVCVARDAALRGLSVGLVDKSDFAAATTAASSKLLHGGLRYLQNLEIGLVRESLRERRIWARTAPHLVDPLTFLMPTSHKHRITNRIKMAIGLRAYDWLAYDRNKESDPDKEIPAHKHLTRPEALALEPALEGADCTGAMEFYDYQMFSPERLALACLGAAIEAGARAANYAKVIGFQLDGGAVTGLHVQDAAPGADPDAPPVLLRGRVTVNAAGPWADLLMGAVHSATGRLDESHDPARKLLRSKGIHVLTRALTRGRALAIPGEHGHIFVLPWRNHSLIGTTDTPFAGDPDDFCVTEKDIVNFLAQINAALPSAQLERNDVLYFYGGLRPLVDTSSQSAEADGPDSYTASRAAEVFDHHAHEGVAGLITAIGGKWTTSRRLAEHVVDQVLVKLGRAPAPCTTAETPVYGGHTGPFADYAQAAAQAHPGLPADTVQHLVRCYGDQYEKVLELAESRPELAKRLSQRFPDIAAEVVYAVREEMALTLDDVLFRRTGVGAFGQPGDPVIEHVAALMAAELGWTPEERAGQIAAAVARFVSWARTRAIVNPRSWGGRTGTLWPQLETQLARGIGAVDAVFTDAPMAATRLTQDALESGVSQIIAVGGDGATNEVVNGFFKNGAPVNPEAMLGILSSGTGGDFKRTFHAPQDFGEQIERLAKSQVRPIDVGKLTYTTPEGGEAVRYFINIASFGLSGATDRAVNRLTYAKVFGGKTAFFWGMLKALATYRNRRVRIQVDDVFDRVVNVCVAAVCNGQFFGGGMHIAPGAEPDDGLFDFVAIADISALRLLRHVGLIYRGEHLDRKEVTLVRGRRIVAEPAEPGDDVVLDVDGETPGRLPATFEMLPKALHLRC